MEKKNIYTVKEATLKLMRYCTYQERCHKEVEQKLRNYYLTKNEQQEVIMKLIDENFLNEERFTKAFVNDKFRLQKWGRHRITRELKFRQISEYLIRVGMQEIEEEEYLNTFDHLFNKKLRSIQEKNPLKLKKKVADFLFRKGYESELIYDRLQQIE